MRDKPIYDDLKEINYKEKIEERSDDSGYNNLGFTQHTTPFNTHHSSTTPNSTSNNNNISWGVEESSTIFDTLDQHAFGEHRFNKSKNLIPALRSYIDTRNEIWREMEIQKVQENINTKIFSTDGHNQYLTKLDLFYYDRDKYFIEEEINESSSEEQIIKAKITKNKTEYNEYLEDKENHHKRKNGDQLIDMEAYCSEEGESEEDDEERDLEGFVDNGGEGNENATENGDLIDPETKEGTSFNLMQFEIEENRKEIEAMERDFYKKYNQTTRVTTEERDLFRVNKELSDSEESIEIEEINLREIETPKQEEEEEESTEKLNTAEIDQQGRNMRRVLKFNKDKILEKYKKNIKGPFRGFR